MSASSLYEMMEQYPSISPMAEYLRDRNCPPGYVETRRKAELRTILTEFKEGQRHPLLALMGALDSTLISSRHALHHLADLSRNQRSFDHYFDFKKMTLEQFQPARRAHIASLISGSLQGQYRDVSFKPSTGDVAWADRLLETLGQSDTKALDVTEQVAVYFVPSKRGYGGKELSADFEKQRKSEDQDALVHPNDKFIEGDLLHLMAGYSHLGWTESSTRDQYQTQKAIELRRAGEIIDALEAWKAGRHPLLAMSDILQAVVENLDHRYQRMFGKANEGLRQEKKARREGLAAERGSGNSEYYLVSILLEQEDVRRQAREVIRQMHEHVVAYRGPESNPKFAAAIDTYIQHLIDTPQSSFRVLDSIAGAMFADDSRELNGIKSQLREIEEKEQKALKAYQPMGALKTQTDAEMRESLAAIFTARAKPEQPPEKLTREIHIEAVGAGMIKPYPTDEYTEHWEEETDGTVTANITTYDVTLIPISPDKIEVLATRVRKALEEIADLEPAFESPFDLAAKPYERPHKNDRYRLRVDAIDGAVKIHTRLDLDDVWNLYYLLEDVIEPSPQIAASMNAARYAEARGVLMTLGDDEGSIGFGRAREYSNENLRPESRIGLLDYHKAEDYVQGMMQDTLALYAIGEIGRKQFLQRLIVLADHTLTGKLVDPSGVFPSWQRLTSEEKPPGTAVTTYGDALKDRVTGILRAMTGATNETTDLFAALKEKVHEMGDELRDRMRAEAHETEDLMWKRSLSRWGSSGTDLKDIWKRLREDFKERTGVDLDEALQGERDAETNGPQEETKKQYELAVRANLAFHAGEVGSTTDRTWRGTKYVSRSPGSIWVRKELPSSLAVFVGPSQRDMGDVMKAIGVSPQA